MRITLTATSSELGMEPSSTLGSHYFRLFVWRYGPSPQFPSMDSGASFTVKQYGEGGGDGEGTLLMEKDLESDGEIRALAEALFSLDGHALEAIVKPMLDRGRKPRKERKGQKQSSRRL